MADEPEHRERNESFVRHWEKKMADSQFCQTVCQLNDKIEHFFAVLGRYIGLYPVWVLSFVLLVLFGLSFGLTNFSREDDLYDLWTPSNSPVHKERKFLKEYWADLDFGTIIIAAVDKDDMDTDIMHEHYLDEWERFSLQLYAHSPSKEWTYTWTNHSALEKTEERTATWNFFPDLWKEPLSLDTLGGMAGVTVDGYASEVVPFCRPFANSPLEAQFQMPCYILQVLDCFTEGGYILPYEEYLAKTFLATIFETNPYKDKPSFKDMSSVEIGSVLGDSCIAWVDQRIPDNMIFGGDSRVSDEDGAALTRVRGFQSIIFSDSDYSIYRKRSMLEGKCIITDLMSIQCPEPTDKELHDAGRMLYKYLEDWIEWMLDEIDEWDDDDDHHLQVVFFTSRSGSDLLKSASSADFLLLGIAYIAMIIFAGLSFLRPSNLFLSRSEASSCGVLIVLCSVIATFGLGSLVVEFSPNVIQVLPFISLGFGVDDMFVLLASFYFDDKKPVEEMTSEALKIAGSSVALTSASNFFAFMVASFMPLPDVARFATVGMIVVSLNWFSIVLGFTAVVALLAGRMKRGYNDWGCCVCYKLDCAVAEKKESERPAHEMESMFDPLFDWFTQDSTRIGAMVSFIALACVGAYGCTLAKVGLPLADIVPAGSYARDFLSVKEEYFYSLTNNWFSDGKKADLKRIDWPNKFEEWVNTTEQGIYGISKYVCKESDGFHGFWAWEMRDYFIEKNEIYFGDDGFTPTPVEDSVEELVGRSSECEAARVELCPSLDANYSYNRSLFRCLTLNADVVYDLNAECTAYLTEVTPAATVQTIARQIELKNDEDPSVEGVYMMPSEDLSMVFYRDDGAVIFRRNNYQWVVLNSNLVPLYESLDTDVEGNEPPQQEWYKYDSKVRVAMSVVLFDDLIYYAGLHRSDDFLYGDLSARSNFATEAALEVDSENSQACFAKEILQKMMLQHSAYKKVTLTSGLQSGGGSKSCNAVLEASDICHGFATGWSHNSTHCGSVEKTDTTTEWWVGGCPSGEFVVAVHDDTAITQAEACMCSQDADAVDDADIDAGLNVFSPCGANFGGFDLDSQSECSSEAQDIEMSCEALLDCTELEVCYEFVEESTDELCDTEAIYRHAKNNQLGRLADCLLPYYAEVDTCCKEAIEYELIPAYSCSVLSTKIGSDADDLKAVCDLTDYCDETCTLICTDALVSDCFEEIESDCKTEWDDEDESAFETCMDESSLGSCCQASFDAENATYYGCLIPLDTYWDFTTEAYDFSICSDADVSSVSCGTNDGEQSTLDCLISNKDSLSAGCCKRAIEMIDNTFTYSVECQGDAVEYCAVAYNVHSAAEALLNDCESVLIDKRDDGDLSDNCYEAVTYCSASVDGVYPQTEVGSSAEVSCVDGFTGTRTRACLSVADKLLPVWNTSDESGCDITYCATEYVDGVTWESVPMGNIRSYIGSDLPYGYLDCGVSYMSAIRICEADGDSAAWREPQKQCRGIFRNWQLVEENYGCPEDDTSSMIFEKARADDTSAEGFKDSCQTECLMLNEHCWNIVYVYDGSSDDIEDLFMCRGYDYCEKTDSGLDADYEYSYQANTATLSEFVAVDCTQAALVGPSDAYSANGIPDPVCFNLTLWQWLVDPKGGVLKRNNLLVNNEMALYDKEQRKSMQLVSSQSAIVLQNIKDDEDAVDYLLDMRDFIKNQMKSRKLWVVPSGLVVSLYTQYIGVAQYMAENLGYVSICIIFTGIIFLLHPVAVCAVLLCDAAMLLEIYGFADWIGLRINGVMALNIVIAVGLTMEFTAHMARAFMLAEAKGSENIGLPRAHESQIRLKKTYREMFTPVTLGAITTLLGVAPISAATFPYFRQYYFVLYVFIVMFGWINGVVFMPMMLSLANPHPWGQSLSAEKESLNEEMLPEEDLDSEEEADTGVVADDEDDDAGAHKQTDTEMAPVKTDEMPDGETR